MGFDRQFLLSLFSGVGAIVFLLPVQVAYAQTNAGLQTSINTEITDRTSADTALGGRIDTERARITSLGHKVNELEKDMSSGIALSLALQAPSVSRDKKVNLSLGAGYYNGETAAAFSFGARMNENWSANGGVGYTGSRERVSAHVRGSPLSFKRVLYKNGPTQGDLCITPRFFVTLFLRMTNWCFLSF